MSFQKKLKKGGQASKEANSGVYKINFILFSSIALAVIITLKQITVTILSLSYCYVFA